MTDANKENFVAIFDVLGFRDLCAAAATPGEVQHLLFMLKTLRKAADSTGITAIQYSDSILLYTAGTDSSDFNNLVQEVAYLIAGTLRRGIRIRGGITRGPFAHDADRRAFAGPALVRAHELEQQQEWIGAIVDPHLARRPELEDAIIERLQDGLLMAYPAPLKVGGVGDLLCVGWPLAYEGKYDGLRASLDDGGSWDVMRKVHNTRQFVCAWLKAQDPSRASQFDG